MNHEAQTEKSFIEILTQRENQWTYRDDLKTEAALWNNLRLHINRINLARLDGVPLTDKEFEQLKVEFKRLTATPFNASQWLRGENGIAAIHIEREDVKRGRVPLVMFSNKDISGGISSYEVVNQINPDTITDMRGDVTLLINGLPVIHVELKTESAKDGYMQAFEQIQRYAESGFFDGIFATTQIFVVSNKISTKYFARPGANTSKAFEAAKKFLFNWRTSDNEPVENLYDFTRQILRIPSAHELISKFTILVDDQKSQRFLMVLRPYQIHAIQKIIGKAAKHEGGFIWHATGSGKTITSFVATKLLAQTSIGVDRTVMVVDRTDLDSQTKGEFNKFASEFHTGTASGSVKENALIVGVDNQRQLNNSLLSKKNNNTIIVTTIQKLSAAVRGAKETENNKFEKLKNEHIVFVVDECHRAVSDEQMKEIKKLLPNSTWFGLTGTPIFEENQKQENGTFARTTQQQYGNLLHAYTTKNAMDDSSVLNFQVQYHCLLDEESKAEYLYRTVKEKYPKLDPIKKLADMTEIEKEELQDKALFERDDYIEAMLKKIFKRQSVIERFKVKNGYPTMSAVLTTHSITQAKLIYHKLKKMKDDGTLLNGRELDERHTLRDPDFPRVTVTYSISENQSEMNEAQAEVNVIMQEYNIAFGANYTDTEQFNKNIINRLARKDVQYQKDGQWLDMVIVVDRLLTGFDAPTIQTLYVDRELKYQKLLQAFSRTNRIAPGKDHGIVVSFRKPATMRKNVEDAIRLFTNQQQNWEALMPHEYAEVKIAFIAAHEELQQAKRELEIDSHNIKNKIAQVKAFQRLEKIQRAIKSYEDYEEDYKELEHIVKAIPEEKGHCENLKSEIRFELENQTGDEMDNLLQEIEFTSEQRAVYEERIDSFYINQLLSKYQKSTNKTDRNDLREKIIQEVNTKPASVQIIYKTILDDIDKNRPTKDWSAYFADEIDYILHTTAEILKVPEANLQTSFNEYRANSGVVPFINVISEASRLSKDDFEAIFNEKYRKRLLVIEQYWKTILDSKLLPLRDEC
ncbi:HsdR family type I site-specific deoxyribonuclease [Paenibacillus sp. DMB5]|uniref:type I restriction endonuclease subunit R n=1 Tax=Paenibacillus sp. DMB5 TaxID=1780103 RepID=UPI00076CBC35|nr:HsdR family type I site-specific deoxyribonuclease [Paenibacillus sp. DMB5]KUP21143.1 DEAD/DEAH box helicase [Paenibacillus sp. DMB5]